jgi:serine/threonine protein phosphatase PrpC
MVLEQSNHIGGVWWFDEKAKTTCVLPNMVSNTRASELSFPGFPFEDFKQDFPTPSEYCLYLQSFVDKFDLEDAIRFNAQVDKVTPSEKDPSCWVVQITDLSVNVPMVFEKVDFVVLANGHFQKPRVFTDEEIPGVESLPKAMQLHSSQFRTTAVASQKNVLVVGIGASAVEILSQVTRVAQEVVACSMRLTGMAKSPRSARSAVSPRTVGTDIGGVTSVRPRIKSISKTGEVTFDDRSTFKPDLIIWCTGFVYDFPMLPKQMIPMRAGYPELYMHMFPMSALCFEDNLAIIGLPSVNGTECVLSLACEQSKLFAALASGKCELPNKKAREAWVQEWQKKSIPSYRPLRVDFKAYVTELNSLIGLKSVVVQDRSFQSSRRTSVSVHSSGESDEEGETEEEGEESNEVAQTPMKRVEPAATVVAQPPAPVPVEAVAAAAATTSPSPGTASPARKLTKSEGSLMGKDAIVKNDRPPPPTTAAPAVPAGAGAFGQPPPAKVGNSQNVAPSPAVSRINSAGSDLQSSKTGVFASFKRTPVKETGTSGLLDRFRAEKKASPYPEDALRKRVRMLSASVHPLMVCVPMSAACGEIGKRDLMEDTHVLLDRIPGVPETIPSGIWCVYDGHGGQEVSRMAEQLLHVKFQKMLINALIIEGKSVNEVNVERLLRRCFKETDKAINEKLWDLKNGGVGSTAAVCVLLGRRLFVANAGDSEVVVSVCRVGEGKTSSIEMSHKHKPRDEREKLRIETMGGMVFGGRVYGTLSVARGFGDTQFVRKTTCCLLLFFFLLLLLLLFF